MNTTLNPNQLETLPGQSDPKERTLFLRIRVSELFWPLGHTLTVYSYSPVVLLARCMELELRALNIAAHVQGVGSYRLAIVSISTSLPKIILPHIRRILDTASLNEWTSIYIEENGELCALQAGMLDASERVTKEVIEADAAVLSAEVKDSRELLCAMRAYIHKLQEAEQYQPPQNPS